MGENIISSIRFSERLRTILQAEADAAFKAHQLADDEFWRACSTQNVGWQVEQAGNKQYISRQALVIALIRLNDFMRHGEISEELDGSRCARGRGERQILSYRVLN